MIPAYHALMKAGLIAAQEACCDGGSPWSRYTDDETEKLTVFGEWLKSSCLSFLTNLKDIYIVEEESLQNYKKLATKDVPKKRRA